MLPLLLGGIYRQIITNIWLKSALASIFIQELGYKLVLTIISHDAKEDMDMSEMEKNNKHLVERIIPSPDSRTQQKIIPSNKFLLSGMGW